MLGFCKNLFRKSKAPPYKQEIIDELAKMFSIHILLQIKASGKAITFHEAISNRWVHGYIFGVAEASKDILGIGLANNNGNPALIVNGIRFSLSFFKEIFGDSDSATSFQNLSLPLIDHEEEHFMSGVVTGGNEILGFMRKEIPVLTKLSDHLSSIVSNHSFEQPLDDEDIYLDKETDTELFPDLNIQEESIVHDDLVTPENLSKELLRQIFDAAFMETSFNKDGDLLVKEAIGCFIFPSQQKEKITMVSAFGFKQESSTASRLECVNKINNEYVMIRAASSINDTLRFDYDIYIKGGVTKKNIVLATKRFLSIPSAAIKEHGKNIVE